MNQVQKDNQIQNQMILFYLRDHQVMDQMTNQMMNQMMDQIQMIQMMMMMKKKRRSTKSIICIFL